MSDERIPGWSWGDIESAEYRPGRDWTALPPTGLSAVLAYLAGPGFARSGSPPVGPARVRTSGPDGRERAGSVDLSDDDLILIGEDIRAFVVDAGLDAPRTAWWQIALRPDELAVLEGRVNDLIELHHAAGQRASLNSRQLSALRLAVADALAA